MNEATGGRKPLTTDIHVGARLRVRRKLLGLSQTQLAEGLSLTFQQIQKYERGANRVSASTLYEAAKILKVSVSFFFEGLPATDEAIEEGEADAATALAATVAGLLATPEGLELAKLFPAIPRGEARRQILGLVRTLGSLQEADSPTGQGD